MEPIRKDVIGGYNSFLYEQRKVVGGIGTRITLIQFDSQNDHEVLYRNIPISEAPELTFDTYVPRALTPLYDAIAKGIFVTESADVTHNKVIFAIITDGQENASREFDTNRVHKMIEEKKLAGWEFVFLSADLNSFAQAKAIGISDANSMAFDMTSVGTQTAFETFASNTLSYSRGDVSNMAWSDQQRSEQDAEKKRNSSA